MTEIESQQSDEPDDPTDVGWFPILIRGIGYVSGFLFFFVARDEWQYARDHPDRYGPANEIALASLAGLGVAVALVLIAAELTRLTANRRGK